MIRKVLVKGPVIFIMANPEMKARLAGSALEGGAYSALIVFEIVRSRRLAKLDHLAKNVVSNAMALYRVSISGCSSFRDHTIAHHRRAGSVQSEMSDRVPWQYFRLAHETVYAWRPCRTPVCQNGRSRGECWAGCNGVLLS